MNWLDSYIKQQATPPSEESIPRGILRALTEQQPPPPPPKQTILQHLMQTWPARMAQSAWSAAKLPGDVYAGRVDPMSQDAINRASDLAGLVMGSTFAASPAGAVGVGPVKRGGPSNYDDAVASIRKLVEEFGGKLSGHNNSSLSNSQYLYFDGIPTHLTKSVRREYFEQYPKASGAGVDGRFTVRISDHPNISGRAAPMFDLRINGDTQAQIERLRGMLEFLNTKGKPWNFR